MTVALLPMNASIHVSYVIDVFSEYSALNVCQSWDGFITNRILPVQQLEHDIPNIYVLHSNLIPAELI